MCGKSVFIVVSLLVNTVCLPITTGRCDTTPERDEKETLGKAAITAYATNISSFPLYKCRYRHTKAQARTIEDAIRGHFLNARFYDNRLIVDGEKDLYEGFAPPPDSQQGQAVPGRKGFIVPSSGNSNRYLGDGAREMNYSPPLRSVNLFSAESRIHGIDITPLGMDFVGHRNYNGPDTWLRQPERYDFSADGLEEADGRPVVTVRFKDKKAFRAGTPQEIAFTYLFSFDGSRGYLPIRIMTLWNGKPKIQVFVTHIRECSNQRWFPERTVSVATPDKDGDLYDVSEIKLLELDVDKRPDTSEFSFLIPAGTTVIDTSKSDGRHFKLEQDEKIRIEDLPLLFARTQQAVDKPLMDVANRHRDSHSRLRWLLGFLGIILALVGAILLLRRFRLKRT
jgi:hypothetical protein